MKIINEGEQERSQTLKKSVIVGYGSMGGQYAKKFLTEKIKDLLLHGI